MACGGCTPGQPGMAGARHPVGGFLQLDPMGYDRPQGRDLPGHGAAIKPGKPLLYLGAVKQRRNGPAVSGLCSLRPCLTSTAH